MYILIKSFEKNVKYGLNKPAKNVLLLLKMHLGQYLVAERRHICTPELCIKL